MNELTGIELPIRLAFAMAHQPDDMADGLLADYRAAVLREQLTEQQRTFLAFALDLAFDEMCSRDGFTDEDWAAHESLKKLAGGAS